MTEPASATRRRFVLETPDTVVRRLPDIGKLMIIGKRNGVTHERIGPVEHVEEDGAFLVCRGKDHDSRLDPRLVSAVVIDTSSVMQDQVYPRIDFNGADGVPVFSVVGFGGLEPFEAALAGLSTEVDPVERPKAERNERAEVSTDDPGLTPLNAALASAATIIIAFDQLGFSQRWSGVVEKVSPAMGFINVMTSDFHLHLLGGTVSRWQEEATEDEAVLVAYSKDERPTGLTLRAKTAAAFRPAN
ncbi:hypothetical protein HT585_30295 [Ensifer sp. HO-A22]|uniref:Haemin-degrading HemS/ChuX domain-containing protein n=1 Tax=Ensifer oleiphilus TaxID=2742698 RepID=A0A7Y6QCM1_9HYPH|nr:hypothetical protein [Ensifer oleiphilus]NVD43164.1 hypothetical protein [Ensifer oleiphilus]